MEIKPNNGNTNKGLFPCNISNTRVSVSLEYRNTKKRVENMTCSRVCYDKIQGVWIADETLSQLIDIIFFSIKIKTKEKMEKKNCQNTD